MDIRTSPSTHREKEATDAMGRFWNHVLGGQILQDTMVDMNLVKATPQRLERQGPTHYCRRDPEEDSPIGHPEG